MKHFWRISLLTLSFTLAMPIVAQAQPSEKDFQLIGRALKFMENGPSGNAEIAVLYADDAPSSVNDADAAVAILAAGLSAGDITLTAKKVSVSDLNSAAGANAIYVSAGLSAHFDAIHSFAVSNKKMTVTTDKSCAASHKCVLSVESQPKVEISLSQSAASATGTSFQSSFRLMVKEL